MRAMPITVTALTAALLLTACSGGEVGDVQTSGSKAGGGKAGGDSTACKIDEVAVEIGPVNAAPAAGDSGNVTVTLTNKSEACTLDGLPAVTLHAAENSAVVAPDPAAQAQKLTLAKDATTSFTLTYVRGEEGVSKSLAVKTVKFNLPGETATHDFDWSYGDVAMKDSSTPDATFSSFQQVGD